MPLQHEEATKVAMPKLEAAIAESAGKDQPASSMAADASPTLVRDHLLDLVMGFDVDSINEEELSIPSSHNMVNSCNPDYHHQ